MTDLLEDNKGLQEGVFQCMHTLTSKGKGKGGGELQPDTVLSSAGFDHAYTRAAGAKHVRT